MENLSNGCEVSIFEWIFRRRLHQSTPRLCGESEEDKVLKLKKTLYKLKQAHWNIRIDQYFQESGFVKCRHEHAPV